MKAYIIKNRLQYEKTCNILEILPSITYYFRDGNFRKGVITFAWLRWSITII